MMIKKIKTLYEAIKFEHTIFALPFAYLGMVLAAHGIPTLWQIAWITLAMANLLPPLLLGLAVTAWVGGFDLIYSCQDLDFDRSMGLHSIPVRFGVAVALRLSTVMHILTIALLFSVGIILHLDLLYWLGLVVATVLLVYEHRLVNPSDLSKLNVAFFNMNGYIAVIVFLCTCLAIYVPWP
jgi:4-hydroxybenzoate polyprenyltransferase